VIVNDEQFQRKSIMYKTWLDFITQSFPYC